MYNLMRKLPIGIQTFEDIRRKNYLYVDKTALVWRMANLGKPYFLSRPRRFGKSLLLSTFKAYFQGKKELFEGLAIEKMETEWNEYPVLHLDLNVTFMDEPMAKNMSFQREYAEPYDWVAQQFKDWAFTLTTAILYYNDYDSIDEDARGLYRKAMAAFGGIAPSYHIELLDKPTIYWDFHSLLLGIQMMFSFMLVDGDQPLRLCKHCQKVFLGSRSNAAFCSPRCKNQYNVYKSREKSKGEAD